MKKLIAFVALSLTSTVAFAGGQWTNVTIMYVTAWSAKSSSNKMVFLVKLSADATGGPSCSTNQAEAVINVSNESDSAVATIQRAMTFGYPVTITGTGSCGVRRNRETIATVTGSQVDNILDEIAGAQARLDELLLRHTDTDPAVIAARHNLTELKKRRAEQLACLRDVLGFTWAICSAALGRL
jgi:hypothetical protein